MKKIIFITSIIGTLFANDVEVISDFLKSDLETLIDKHPKILKLKTQSETSAKTIDLAKALLFPTIKLNGDFGFERVSPPFGNITTENRKSIALSITQKIYDGDITNKKIENSKLQNQIANLQLTNTIDEVIKEGVNIILETLKQDALLKLKYKEIENLNKLNELMVQKEKSDSVTSIDMLNSKHELLKEYEKLNTIISALDSSKIKYKNFFNKEFDIKNINSQTIPKIINSNNVINLTKLPTNLEQFKLDTLNKSPKIAIEKYQIDISKNDEEMTKAQYLPTLEIVGRLSSERDKAGLLGQKDENYILMQLNWDIFNGFATKYSVEQSSLKKLSIMHNYELIKNEIERDIELAYQKLESLKKREEILFEINQITNSIADAKKRERELGRIDKIEELKFNKNIVKNSSDLVEIEYEILKASINILTLSKNFEINSKK